MRCINVKIERGSYGVGYLKSLSDAVGYVQVVDNIEGNEGDSINQYNNYVQQGKTST